MPEFLRDPLLRGDNRDMAAVVEDIPLAKDEFGVFRVGGTRVTLDLVIGAFERGATAEEIAQRFPSLHLPDVYQVIGYYLNHREELQSYLEARRDEERTLLSDHQEWSPAGLRERLLSRRKTG